MALEELSWVGVLGYKIGIAEDALRLIIGMVLGETLFCRRIFTYVFRNQKIPPFTCLSYN